MNLSVNRICHAVALATLGLLLGLAPVVEAQEPKPRPKPAPSPYDPPKQPAKRSHFCTEKSDGWYCGENGEPRLFLCKDGQIQDGKDCPAGCDSSRNQCKAPR